MKIPLKDTCTTSLIRGTFSYLEMSVMSPSALFISVLWFVPLLTFITTAEDQNRTLKKELIKKHMTRLKSPDVPVRLVNGREPHEGNVEVYHNGKWGSVCDDGWDRAEADITCRQMGYNRSERITHSSQFGPSKRRFWMDNLECDGSEESITNCRFDGWGKHDCEQNEGAGVICETNHYTTSHPVRHQPPKKTKIKDKFKIHWILRLNGGRVKEEGRVEIKLRDGDFGGICGDGWSLLEGNVVCRELGLGFAVDAPQTDFFGGNSSELLLSGVQCRGNEPSLHHCLHNEHFTCPGNKHYVASVVCSKQIADLVLDADEIMRTAHLEDRQLFFLQCAMEENCVSSAAYELQKQHPNHWHLETRRLLRFTLKALNAGTADFKPFVPKNLWEWHACHMHYHSMEVFATFDVLDKTGTRVAEGHKASFCLEDNQCMPGVEPMFACANYGDQGISVNCSDIYKYNIDCQWVDISELDPGIYTLKVSINPEFKIGEMSFENNAAVCNMHYSETFVYVHNCSLQVPNLRGASV